MQLEALLQSIANRNPTFGNGLTNHAPMLAIALDRLGADDALIERKTILEAHRAEVCAARSECFNETEISQHLGDPSAYAGYLNTFRNGQLSPSPAQISALDGLAGDAFHGLIRLAYGVESKSPTETAAGWAYLCSSYLRLPAPQGAFQKTIDARMAELRKAKLESQPEKDLIWQELESATHTAAYQSTALDPESLTLPNLARNALDLYLSAPGIDTLHAVTGTHALYVIFSEYGDVPSARSVGIRDYCDGCVSRRTFYSKNRRVDHQRFGLGSARGPRFFPRYPYR